MSDGPQRRVGVAIVTRDRAESLLAVLERTAALPERPPVVVVDNGSVDGTPARVRASHPAVRVVGLASDHGAGARTIAARTLTTPYVAFQDDDSWWEPGSLGRAADLLDAHPDLALVAARVLVGAAGTLDPVSALMAASPVPGRADLPGRPVLGFLACAAVVRRSAFLAAGGFERRLGIGGEETLLAVDLAAAGLGVRYVDELLVHHHPAPRAPGGARPRREVRNALWTAWLRRPARSALRETARRLRGAPVGVAAPGALDAVCGLPWVLRARRRLPDEVERGLRLLDR